MITTGVMFLGFLLPEIWGSAFKVTVPPLQNIICSIGCGLISAGIVYG